MKIGTVIIVVWLVIGALAALQRGYFDNSSRGGCAKVGTVLVTIVAGPLNYVGVNPKIDNCKVPLDKRGPKPRPDTCRNTPTG